MYENFDPFYTNSYREELGLSPQKRRISKISSQIIQNLQSKLYTQDSDRSSSVDSSKLSGYSSFDNDYQHQTLSKSVQTNYKNVKKLKAELKWRKIKKSLQNKDLYDGNRTSDFMSECSKSVSEPCSCKKVVRESKNSETYKNACISGEERKSSEYSNGIFSETTCSCEKMSNLVESSKERRKSTDDHRRSSFMTNPEVYMACLKTELLSSMDELFNWDDHLATSIASWSSRDCSRDNSFRSKPSVDSTRFSQKSLPKSLLSPITVKSEPRHQHSFERTISLSSSPRKCSIEPISSFYQQLLRSKSISHTSSPKVQRLANVEVISNVHSQDMILSNPDTPVTVKRNKSKLIRCMKEPCNSIARSKTLHCGQKDSAASVLGSLHQSRKIKNTKMIRKIMNLELEYEKGKAEKFEKAFQQMDAEKLRHEIFNM